MQLSIYLFLPPTRALVPFSLRLCGWRGRGRHPLGVTRLYICIYMYMYI